MTDSKTKVRNGVASETRSNEQKVRTKRLFVIDEAIRTGKYPNTDKLAAIAEVNSRTIQRDIEYLRDMFNAPIEYSPSHRGFYYTEQNYYLKSVPLTEGELFSIALFDQLLEQYRNTPLEKALRKIFQKIVECLPDNVSIDTGFISSQMTFIPDHAGMIDAQVFKTIFSSLKIKHTVNFEYRPLQKTTYMKRSVDPYHGVCQRGNWYIVGFCHDKNEPRMFSLSRMRNTALTKNSFTIPEDFNAKKYFDKAMGVWASSRAPSTIELLVDKEIGTFALERQWHSTQHVEQREDGVYVKFTTNQMPEVLRWVLGQGHTVKVLAPAELVDMVKSEAERVKKMYTGDSPC
jgi:predicted DNA-binding transcriptional regulator YafY